MTTNDRNEELRNSADKGTQLKKYAKMARTSVLAISMGASWLPVHASAAQQSDLQAAASTIQSPIPASTEYTGNSLDYFRNEYLPRSAFLAISDGEGHAPPTASGVSIAGMARVGQTLAGTYSYHDDNCDAESGSLYEWYRSDDAGQSVNYVPIPLATGSTYTLTSEDVGKYITFVVTPRTTVSPEVGDPTRSAATLAVSPAPIESATVSHANPPNSSSEEVLIEINAEKKNDNNSDSAKLVVSKDGGGTKAAFRFLAQGVIDFSKESNKKETISVRASSLKGAKEVTAEISGDAVAALKSNNQKLAVLTGDVAIEFPTSSIPLDNLVKNSGVAADKLKIEAKIEKQPEAVKQQLQQWTAQQKGTAIGDPIKFSLQANDGKAILPIAQYGNKYASMTVPIPAGVQNLKALGAVMLLDGNYVPVPVRIVDSEHAVIHVPTNGTVMLVQRDTDEWNVSSHWANNDILTMANKGNVNGGGHGSYKPDAKITQGEFSELLVNSMGLGHQVDVAAQELLRSVTNGIAAPDKEITREQMIAILMRFYKEFELEPEASSVTGNAPAFKDLDRVSGWAQADVSDAIALGIVSGYKNRISPLSEGTQAEAAALIRRFLQKTGLTN